MSEPTDDELLREWTKRRLRMDSLADQLEGRCDRSGLLNDMRICAMREMFFFRDWIVRRGRSISRMNGIDVLI